MASTSTSTPPPSLSPLHLDVIALVLDHLHARRDLYHCALVSRAFHTAAIPHLYRRLDTKPRVIRGLTDARIIHPAATLICRPSYAHHVRHISETATAGDVASSLMPIACAALGLCTNLRSFSWTGGGFLSDDDSSLVAHLDTILAHRLPLRALVLRASPGLSPAAWARLGKLTSLRSLGLWCIDADHAALLEWLAALSETLTRLELVISPLSDQYMQYLSRLPHLRTLCLKSATRCSIPDILALIPTLTSLTVEYYGYSPIARHSPSENASQSSPLPPRMARLRTLTITTSTTLTSCVSGPWEIWAWILSLVPHTSLEEFTLRAFPAPQHSPRTAHSTAHAASSTFCSALPSSASSANTQPTPPPCPPPSFIHDMLQIHGSTMRSFVLDGVGVRSAEFAQACAEFEQLVTIGCTLLDLGPDPGVVGGEELEVHAGPCGAESDSVVRVPVREHGGLDVIEAALRGSATLREARLGETRVVSELTTDDARRWMVREGSALRVVEAHGKRFTVRTLVGRGFVCSVSMVS